MNFLRNPNCLVGVGSNFTFSVVVDDCKKVAGINNYHIMRAKFYQSTLFGSKRNYIVAPIDTWVLATLLVN